MSHELIGLAFITSITSLTVLYYNRDKIWEVFEKISDFFDIDDPNNDYKIISKVSYVPSKLLTKADVPKIWFRELTQDALINFLYYLMGNYSQSLILQNITSELPSNLFDILTKDEIRQLISYIQYDYNIYQDNYENVGSISIICRRADATIDLLLLTPTGNKSLHLLVRSL